MYILVKYRIAKVKKQTKRSSTSDFLHIKGKNDDEKFENLIAAIEELKEKVEIKRYKDYGESKRYTRY